MSGSSKFEQFSLQKVGQTCILGGVERGIQWGILVSDFLLLRALTSKRYSQIICLLSDRRVEDLKKVVNVSSSNNNIAPSICDMNGLENLDAIYDICKATVSTTSSSDKSRALFIYSLSEWILLFGTQRVLILLDKLTALGFHQIIACVNQTFHSHMHLAHLISHFSVIARTLPNDGTLSGEVLLHIHTTRRSDRSGRVAESIELFGDHSGLLLMPLKPISERRDLTTEGHTTSTSALQRLNPVVPSVSSMNLNMDKAADEVAAAAARRLITFESTDPEFDEDSDPDNDLDL